MPPSEEISDASADVMINGFVCPAACSIAQRVAFGFINSLGLCGVTSSALNIPPHMIAVYASQPPSPPTTQHSLEGGSLLPYPHRSLTGWTTPALPGALITNYEATPNLARYGRANS
jgi:hypothetical protein